MRPFVSCARPIAGAARRRHANLAEGIPILTGATRPDQLSSIRARPLSTRAPSRGPPAGRPEGTTAWAVGARLPLATQSCHTQGCRPRSERPVRGPTPDMRRSTLPENDRNSPAQIWRSRTAPSVLISMPVNRAVRLAGDCLTDRRAHQPSVRSPFGDVVGVPAAVAINVGTVQPAEGFGERVTQALRTLERPICGRRSNMTTAPSENVSSIGPSLVLARPERVVQPLIPPAISATDSSGAVDRRLAEFSGPA